MEEENGTVFRNFFFRERLKECVCVEREGQISRIDRSIIYVFFGERSAET